MNYILMPLSLMAVIGLACLNIKIGFIVGDWTENTGFHFGFYMITVVGLFAAEISAAAYLLS